VTAIPVPRSTPVAERPGTVVRIVGAVESTSKGGESVELVAPLGSRAMM
jgi:hypothetical protein